MARPPKYSSEQILDSAMTLLAAGGPQRVTVAGVAAAIGGPTGSIYHRFATRDLLMARLWIRTVRRAQEGFVAALELPDLREAAHTGALHVPRWSRGHPVDARVLLLHRRQELAEAWPEELGLELDQLNRPLAAALDAFTARLPGRLTPSKREAVRMALIDTPYGVTRRHLLADRVPPTIVDRLLVATCDTLLFGSASR